MLAQAAQFLASALPWPEPGSWTGTPPFYVNIHWVVDLPPDDKTGKPRQARPGRACTTLEQALNQIEYRLMANGGSDIFVCMSGQLEAKPKLDKRGRTYFSAIRLRTNAVWLKSIWLDIDVKEASYRTTLEAAENFARFRLTTGLPDPTFVVMTGSGGFHVHWVMSEAITPVRHAMLTAQLYAATQQHGLVVDSVFDPSRILRIPDTFNYKHTPPRPAYLQAARGEYRPEYLEDILKSYSAMPAVQVARRTTSVPRLDPAMFPPRPPITNSILGAGIERTTIDLQQVKDVCPLVREAVTQGGNNHSQPLWHALASLSVHLVGGRAAFHEMSNGYPTYNETETDELFDRVEGDHFRLNTGWTQCSTLERAGSAECANCAHRLEGKSPLNFVQRYLPAPAVQVSPIVQPLPAVLVPKKLPAPYCYIDDYCVVREVPSTDTEPTKFVEVFEHPFIDPWAQEGEPGRFEEAVNFTSSFGSRPRKIQVLMRDLGSSDKLSQRMADWGLPIEHPKEFKKLLMSYIHDLRKRKETAARSERMGWAYEEGNPAAFTYGGTRHNCRGDLPVVLSDAALQREYSPTGSPEPWRKAIAKLIGISPQLDTILVSPFAGPLVAFTGLPGMTLSCWSTDSGVGKTTAMLIGNAVMGNKMLHSIDTSNALMRHLAKTNNLTQYFDEARSGGKNDERIRQVIFAVTNGRDKSRLNRSSQLIETETWQTMLVTAANSSLITFLNDQSRESAAAMYRIFECEVPPVATDKFDHELKALVGTLPHNYGHAGMVYFKYLGQNAELVRQRVVRCEEWLVSKLNVQPSERFWTSAMAVEIVGAIIANELGLTSFNIERLAQYLKATFSKLRVQKLTDTIDFSSADVLAQFCREFWASHRLSVLITNTSPLGGPGRPGAPQPGVTAIRNPEVLNGRDRIAGRYAEDTKTLWIDRAVFGGWLRKQGLTSSHIIDQMKKHLGAQELPRMRIARGTGKHSPQTFLIEFGCGAGPLKDFVDLN